MSSVTNNIIPLQAVNQTLPNLNQDPTSSIPDDLFFEVFSYLDLSTLGTICCVNKRWKQLASDPLLQKKAILKELAFSNDSWAKCFGNDVVKDEDREEEFLSLPLDIAEEYKKFQIAFPEIRAKQNLMLVRLPKTLNGQLTLNSLGELARKYFPHNPTGYYQTYFVDEILDGVGDKTIDKSRWVLMTTNVLWESRQKLFVAQKAIFGREDLVGYEMPEVLEATTCILSQYFKDSKTRLFYKDPLMTSTSCIDEVEGKPLVVGDFSEIGLIVDFRCQYGDLFTGTAVVRRL